MGTSKPEPKQFVSADPGKCNGCGICEYVCSLEKEGVANPLKSRIRVLRLNRLLNMAMVCRFCDDAPCIKACPRDALNRSEQNGVLIIDAGNCDACGWCVEACPYGGIAVLPDKGVVAACDLCKGEPKCIEFCPEEALELADEEASAQKLVSALEKIPSEAERLIDLIKNKEWTRMLAESEEKVAKLEKKLGSIKEKERTSKHS